MRMRMQSIKQNSRACLVPCHLNNLIPVLILYGFLVHVLLEIDALHRASVSIPACCLPFLFVVFHSFSCACDFVLHFL
jgi:hypothetical protein